MAKLFRHPTDPPAADYPVRRSAARAADLLDPAHPGWRDVTPIAWGPEKYRTRFRATWSADALVVRFDSDDDQPWWTMTTRDEHIWNEEVVEVFLDPARSGTDYAEIEINPANTVCDLRVARPWPSLSSDTAWDWAGMRTTVTSQRAEGGATSWTAIAWLPFDGLRSLSAGAARRVPPTSGDRWGFNVFRIKRPGGASQPERDVVYAAWSVPDGPSFHDPAKFKDLIFG